MGEVLGLDTLLHLVALGIALGYGYKNRQWLGFALAVVSPFVFVALLATGPWLPADGDSRMLDTPTVPNVAVAYVVANLVLATGLWLTSVPAQRDQAANDQSSGDVTRFTVSPTDSAARHNRAFMGVLVATPLAGAMLVVVAIAVWWSL
ncbi:MAG: hypothetical protein WBO25_01180 [Acidimicrobiia bacterium]